MRLLHAKRALRSASDFDALKKEFLEFASQYGVDFFTCFTLGVGGKMEASNYYGCFDHQWPLHYKNRGFMHKDPALQASFLSLEPIIWSEVAAAVPGGHDVVFAEAQAFGFKDGIVVPMRDPEGCLSIFSIAGTEFEATAENVAILSDLARTANTVARKLYKVSGDWKEPALAERERQVVTLMRDGKSDWEISQILTISEHTAKKHRANIRKKLGATSTREAVFLAYAQDLFVAVE